MRLYDLALIMSHNPADAEDLLFRTLERVLDRIEQYRENQPFYPWLCRILINFHLKNMRPKMVAALTFTEHPHEMEDTRLDAGEQCATLDDAKVVRMAVDSLPKKLKTTVLLRYFEDMSVPEVAIALDISEGTVKSRLNAARAKIRLFLSRTIRR